MGVARLVLKPSDYREVGEVGLEELREIVRVSGVNPLLLAILAAYSIVCAYPSGELFYAFSISYVIVYALIRYVAPSRQVSAAGVIPRSLMRAYVITLGVPMEEIVTSFLVLLMLELINEKIT